MTENMVKNNNNYVNLFKIDVINAMLQSNKFI